MSRILIIDDEVDIAELESDALTDEGFDVDIAHLASEANILLEKNNYNYDLILLDIMMPGKSGTEYLNEIRNKITCPIIFVSAKLLFSEVFNAMFLSNAEIIPTIFS